MVDGPNINWQRLIKNCVRETSCKSKCCNEKCIYNENRNVRRAPRTHPMRPLRFIFTIRLNGKLAMASVCKMSAVWRVSAVQCSFRSLAIYSLRLLLSAACSRLNSLILSHSSIISPIESDETNRFKIEVSASVAILLHMKSLLSVLRCASFRNWQHNAASNEEEKKLWENWKVMRFNASFVVFFSLFSFARHARALYNLTGERRKQTRQSAEKGMGRGSWREAWRTRKKCDIETWQWCASRLLWNKIDSRVRPIPCYRFLNAERLVDWSLGRLSVNHSCRFSFFIYWQTWLNWISQQIFFDGK